MLRVGLGGGGQPQDLVLAATSAHHHGGHRGPASRQCAGLVEDDEVELAGALEGQAVLHQQPILGADRRRDGDDQGDGQAEGMGAGDDEHGGRADERLLRVTEHPPDYERHDARAERDVEQQRGGAIGQGLGA